MRVPGRRFWTRCSQAPVGSGRSANNEAGSQSFGLPPFSYGSLIQVSNLALAGKPRKRFTPSEYLTLEREASEKSEYYDGEIYAMASGAESHNAIATNIRGLLWSLLRKHGCQTYGSDMRVGVTPLGPFF